jgi:hypothetical protein
MGPRPTFNAAGAGEHYLDGAGKGADITRKDLLGLHKAAGLKEAEVSDMIDAALAAVGDWSALATINGVAADIVARNASLLPVLAA